MSILLKSKNEQLHLLIMNKKIQLVIIGGGPGGYTAAFLAADNGMDVTLIDADGLLGGACLHRGCIPSKTLLHNADIISQTKEAANIGIKFNDPDIDLNTLKNHKNEIINKLHAGLIAHCKKKKVNLISGQASFLSNSVIKITDTNRTEQEISFDKAIIATGSEAIKLPFDSTSANIIDSTKALNIESIPERMLIVGGGYIGLELGTIYSKLRSKVDIVEMTDSLLPGIDADLIRVLKRRLDLTFNKVSLKTKVIEMSDSDDQVKVKLEDKTGAITDETYDKILVSIGRSPSSDNIGLENTNISKNDKNFINVNPHRRTNEPNIYAIGDVTGNPMLAHKASYEARIAINDMIGNPAEQFSTELIPSVVYTDPEIAYCGLTEIETKKRQLKTNVKKIPWSASGRATTLNRCDGLTKLIIDEKTNKILGVAIAGINAGELITEGILAINMGLTTKDISNTIHPHPTLSETLLFAAKQ